MRKRIGAILTVGLLITYLPLPQAIPAGASTGYRYWGYFQAAPGATTWTMAMTGPTTNIRDGSVEGWMHTFSSDEVEAAAPRIKPNFNQICQKVRPIANKKRIALVIDFGTAAIRPRGESLQKRVRSCVQVDLNATGSEILAAVAKIRATSSGLICGINGYPAEECSAKIKTPRTLGR